MKKSSERFVEFIEKDSSESEFSVYYDKDYKIVGVEDEKCICKKVVQEKAHKTITNHYIKADDYGVLIDPWGLFTGKQKNKKNTQVRPNSEYVRVSEKVFDLYCKYLQTRNKNYYLHCDREVKNG